MAIRRGVWQAETVKKTATVKSGRFGARPAKVVQPGVSNSEQHLIARASEQKDFSAITGVSEHRQEELIRATGINPANAQSISPLIVYSSSYQKAQKIKEHYGLVKSAGITTGDGLTSGSSMYGNTVRQSPEVYSPLFQMANLQLPRDRITMNAWNRNFYDTHPLVHNCINLHATYPISKINIKCKHREVEQFFNNMVEQIDLINVLQSMALEIFKLGEAIPYAELDENKGVWKSIILQNPDYIHIKTSVLSGEAVISMRPDAALQRLVQSNHPADIQIRQQIDEEILYHVRKGNNIPLDNFHVSHLAIKSSPYDIHGTSPIVSVYKDIMLYDRLRESKYAQADSLINPITLVKIGGTADGEYRATNDDLEKWRQTFEAATYDHDFKIITHAGVSVERVGAAGQIIDIAPDMAFILDNILFGLMIPKSVISQEGASFNSATVGLEVLKQRYESFRNMIGQWLTKKIFAPISEIQEFYEYEDGDKKLIVPEIEWNKMVLFDMDNYIGTLNTLVGQGMVSKTTLFHSLGLNPEEERRQLKEEMIAQAISAKESAILQTMPLGALRALKPSDDIIEQTEIALPGTPGTTKGGEESGLPGAMPDLGLPPLGGPPGGGGLGGLPPLGGPSGGAGMPPPMTTPSITTPTPGAKPPAPKTGPGGGAPKPAGGAGPK